MPPLIDYPNHLARAVVLANHGHDPVLARMYAPRWALIPNLALDLALPPLVAILPVHVAGRLILALELLLPVAGTILLARVVTGRRTWWSLAVTGVACNELFLFGFVNFQLTVGLALIFAAAYYRWRESRPGATAVLATAAATILFVGHLMALALFLVLAAAHELMFLWRARGRGLLHRGALCLPLVAAPLILFLNSSFSTKAPGVQWRTLSDKLFHLLVPLMNYGPRLDLLAGAVLASVLLTCAARRALHIEPRVALALAVMLLCYALAPADYKGTAALDLRFPAMAGFLLFAAIRPAPLDRRTAALIATALTLLFAIRTAAIAAVWHDHRRILAELRETIEPVPPGSRVLIVFPTLDDPASPALAARPALTGAGRLLWHTAALLLIERGAWWPTMFANPEQQPIELLPPYRAIADGSPETIGLHLLTTTAPTDAERARFPLAGRWTCCYDYVLLQESAATPALTLETLELIRRTSDAALYRVRSPAP